MLTHFSVRNYAIIENLELVPSHGLTIITGETGAGKSILTGALGLVLGERADTSVLVNKDVKCVVEAVFKVGNNNAIRQLLHDHDHDPSDELLIRREIAANGKSRAFINDTPVTLNQLSEFSSQLVDLHQQFDTFQIGSAGFQREVIDALADNTSLRSGYREQYAHWKELTRQLDELQNTKASFEKEYDYNQFQFNELNELNLRENEIEELESKVNALSHSESIKSVVNSVTTQLSDGDEPLVQKLKSMYQQLGTVSSYHPDLQKLRERLQAAQVELNDIADDLERVSDHIEFDPAELERMNERISEGYRLQKKHGVRSTAELLAIRAGLEEKLNAVLNSEEQIRDLEASIATAFKSAHTIALKISDSRKKQVKPFETKVNKLLAQIGMPNARLKVVINETELNANGLDSISFTFNANVGTKGDEHINYSPVEKVASGGELSRLMLSIKSLVASSLDMPTLVFDEIDTGISGEAARQVGLILKDLASKRQVICITHQPQIASKADVHFFVYKDIVGNKVKTTLRELSNEERITTIAKMLSGEKPTAAALANARELVGN